jgi:hypothetical protein
MTDFTGVSPFIVDGIVVDLESFVNLRECSPEGTAILTEFKLNPGDVIKPTPR